MVLEGTQRLFKRTWTDRLPMLVDRYRAWRTHNSLICDQNGGLSLGWHGQRAKSKSKILDVAGSSFFELVAVLALNMNSEESPASFFLDSCSEQFLSQSSHCCLEPTGARLLKVLIAFDVNQHSSNFLRWDTTLIATASAQIVHASSGPCSSHDVAISKMSL